MKEIINNGIIVARYISIDDIKPGLNFFSNDSDFIQVGVWGHYEKNKELKAHVHNKVERNINRTYEVLYVITGCIEATIYDLEGTYICKIIVNRGEILTLLECGHGYIIKGEDTTVLEIKNGPYLGPEIDRRRI